MPLPSGVEAPPAWSPTPEDLLALTTAFETALASGPAPAPAPAEQRPVRHRRVGWWLALGALLPMFVLFLRTPFQDWLPIGDVGTIALRVAEVGTRHTPLVGPYSHFGWSHPGPVLFEILAAPYRVFGTGGLLLGALLINGVAMWIIATRLYRAGGVAVAAFGIGCFWATSWSLGLSWVWYPWNPNIAMLPFAALLVLTWTSARNSRWDLPLLALVASFLAQTHVAYAPFVVALVPIALLGRGRRRAPGLVPPPNPPRAARDRAPVFLAIAVLVVAWLPPIVDALVHDGGNLRDLVDFWLTDHQTLGFGSAFRIVFLELSVRAPWIGFHEPTFLGAVAPRGTPIPIGLFLVVGAAIAAWRAGDRFALRCALTVLACIGVAVLSIARIVGFAYPYLVFATRVIGAASVLVTFWIVVRLVRRERHPRLHAAITGVAVVVGIVVLAGCTISAGRAGIGTADEQRASSTLSRVAAAALPNMAHADRVRVDSGASFSGSSFKVGLMYYLVQHGYEVTTDGSDRLRLGSHYASSEPTDITLVVTAGPQEFDRVASTHRLLAESARPVQFPVGAPPPRPGEDPYVYLRRVRDRVDRATYRRLVTYMTGRYPIAVFESG